MQRAFPKAAVRDMPNRQNPIQSFAAPVFNVSDADFAAIRILNSKDRSQPKADMTELLVGRKAVLRCNAL